MMQEKPLFYRILNDKLIFVFITSIGGNHETCTDRECYFRYDFG
jgi:hypothetical protein